MNNSLHSNEHIGRRCCLWTTHICEWDISELRALVSVIIMHWNMNYNDKHAVAYDLNPRIASIRFTLCIYLEYSLADAESFNRVRLVFVNLVKMWEILARWKLILSKEHVKFANSYNIKQYCWWNIRGK